MKSGIMKLLAGVSLVAVSALGVVPAGASPVSILGGNDATVNAPELDGWINFAIVDTNNPISRNGVLTSWSFYAGRAGTVELLVVTPGAKLVYVSPPFTVSNQVGTTVTVPLPYPWVQQGDYVGLYFVNNAGVVPFTGCNCIGSNQNPGGNGGSVYYTAYDSGSASTVAVGQTLIFGNGTGNNGGAVNRVYSFSVTGFASNVPTAALCKDDGWQAGPFRNQGACVSAFASAGDVPIGSSNSSWLNN